MLLTQEIGCAVLLIVTCGLYFPLLSNKWFPNLTVDLRVNGVAISTDLYTSEERYGTFWRTELDLG